MAMTPQNVSWKGHRSGSYRPMSEINVTPLVDVMLVLLIVFMVTAPLLAVGVPVDLPRSEARPMPQDNQPLAVSIDKEGRIYLQETEVNLQQLVARLDAIAVNRDDRRIYVRADTDINYGRVVEVMGMLNAAGFSKVALVSDIPRRR